MGKTLRPDFTSNLVRALAFGAPKFYIAPYDKINHGLVNVSSNCDVKSGLSIFHGCIVWIEKTVTRVTDRHHEACRVMPNSDPE